jgi:hypothetical protein
LAVVEELGESTQPFHSMTGFESGRGVVGLAGRTRTLNYLHTESQHLCRRNGSADQRTTNLV